MREYELHILPADARVRVRAGETLQSALTAAGFRPDAPCGGRGVCGKCAVTVNGRAALACQTRVRRNMTVLLPEARREAVLTDGAAAPVIPDGADRYVLAFDVGTTTVVAYLLDGRRGRELAAAAAPNPQRAFGADVISRIQYVLRERNDTLRALIWATLRDLAQETAARAGVACAEITLVCVVGNTCMHHLLLGVDPAPLCVPPYSPALSAAIEEPLAGRLPLAPGAVLRVLPNIAGFVGADTVGCMTATDFDRLPGWSLLVDVGTNGEMALGCGARRIACSAAAGPAFEGAGISCGMRAAEGAIDRVRWENGALACHVIGGGRAAGLCGSGLLDAAAALRAAGLIDGSGAMTGGRKSVPLRDRVTLTQKDVRELQLAKSAIRTGIELMAEELGVAVGEIDRVLLAGAFGSRLSPESACAIGLLPPVLRGRARAVGNAAGAGAKRCALSRAAFEHSRELAAGTRFLELASRPAFQDRFVEYLSLEEEAP